MVTSVWQWVYTIAEVSDFSPQTALLRVAYPYPYVRNDGTVDKPQHVRWLPPPPPPPPQQQQQTNKQWRSARIGANHSRTTDMFDNDRCVSAGVVPVQVSAHVPRKTTANIYTLGIGRFNEAALHEWMPFVIFRTRSRERLQRHFRADFWVGVVSRCV